ncbi:MAG: alpha/beta fold hydrolase [Polyangiaceae bacterium]
MSRPLSPHGRALEAVLETPFTAPRWLSNKHLQSLGAALPLWAPPRSFRPARTELLRMPLPSGGALHAHAWWHESGPRRRRVAILVHGVGGSSASRYVVRAAVSMYRAGWHVVRLDLRGAGESIGDAPALYHAGLTEDLKVAIDSISKCEQANGVVLIGVSLGGHVVLRLAGELGERDPGALLAAVSVSAPLDLTSVTRAIERLRSLPYHRYVLRNLVRQGAAFARAHPHLARYDAASLNALRTIREYDGHVIAPMHGFASAEDYYARVSAGPLVEAIRLPVLLIHAEDDPMVPASTVRAWLTGAPPCLEQAWTARGGHVGWFADMTESRWVDTWWLRRARAFLASYV